MYYILYYFQTAEIQLSLHVTRGGPNPKSGLIWYAVTFVILLNWKRKKKIFLSDARSSQQTVTSTCTRLYILVAAVKNTSAGSAIRSWDLTHCSLPSLKKAPACPTGLKSAPASPKTRSSRVNVFTAFNRWSHNLVLYCKYCTDFCFILVKLGLGLCLRLRLWLVLRLGFGLGLALGLGLHDETSV